MTREASVRWWPALLVLLLGAGGFLYIWLFWEASRQDRTLATLGLSGAMLIAQLLWVVFFSRLPGFYRKSATLGVLALLLLGTGLFRVRGVTGDMLPILEWRWKSPPVAAAASEPPAGVDESASHSYPQFLGPARDGIVPVQGLASDWYRKPWKELWRRPVGAAWSGFAVAGERAVTQEQHGLEERVTCYHLRTGALLWSHADAARYATTIAGEGPRATPTLADGRVLAIGATGILNCLDLKTGKKLWSVNVVHDHRGEELEWGIAGSPLVIGNRVIVHPGGTQGGSLAAYDLQTGKRIWAGGNDPAGYSSPALVSLAGRPHILIFNASAVASHDPEDGRVLWRYPWRGGHPHITVPIVLPGDRVLVSSGYGTGSELVQVTREGEDYLTSRIWKAMHLKSKFANLFYHDRFIYGLDDGIMVCLDAASGKMRWKEGRYGHGQLLRAGDLFLVMAESGQVVFVAIDPEAHRELGRVPVLRSKTWNPPALAGACLVVRNDLEAVCFELPTAGSDSESSP